MHWKEIYRLVDCFGPAQIPTTTNHKRYTFARHDAKLTFNYGLIEKLLFSILYYLLFKYPQYDNLVSTFFFCWCAAGDIFRRREIHRLIHIAFVRCVLNVYIIPFDIVVVAEFHVPAAEFRCAWQVPIQWSSIAFNKYDGLVWNATTATITENENGSIFICWTALLCERLWTPMHMMKGTIGSLNETCVQ